MDLETLFNKSRFYIAKKLNKKVVISPIGLWNPIKSKKIKKVSIIFLSKKSFKSC